MTFLTAYQLFIVYFCKKMRCKLLPSLKDIRMRCLFVTFLNGALVGLSIFPFSINFVIRSFTVFELARYTLLFTLCILYAHAVSRNIIKWRKKALTVMLTLFCMTLFIILLVSLNIVQK